VEIERLVKPDIGGEVQASVEKRESAEHPAELERGDAQKFSQWSNCKGDKKKAQRPVAGGVGNLLDRISAQADSPGAHVGRSGTKEFPQQHGQRRQAGDEDGDFDPANHEGQLLVLGCWLLS
jgi:hypothetical protein